MSTLSLNVTALNVPLQTPSSALQTPISWDTPPPPPALTLTPTRSPHLLRFRPINALPKQGVKLCFNPQMETIVRQIINELATPPILVYPDWDAVTDNFRPFHLYCDAT